MFYHFLFFVLECAAKKRCSSLPRSKGPVGAACAACHSHEFPTKVVDGSVRLICRVSTRASKKTGPSKLLASEVVKHFEASKRYNMYICNIMIYIIYNTHDVNLHAQLQQHSILPRHFPQFFTISCHYSQGPLLIWTNKGHGKTE